MADIQSKRERFNGIVKDLKRISYESVSRKKFLYQSEYACLWCKRTYGLDDKERIQGLLIVSDDLQRDSLVLLSNDDNKGAHYMAKHHPVNECPFAKGRLYEHVYGDNAELSNLILTKGLHSVMEINTVIKTFIKSGVNEELYTNIMDNQLRRVAYTFDANTTKEEIARYLKYYTSYRKRHFQFNTWDTDNGKVRIYSAPCPYRDPYQMHIEIQGDVGAIMVSFPCPVVTRNVFYEHVVLGDFENTRTCYHTANRVMDARLLGEALVNHFHLTLDLFIPNEAICSCSASPPMPVVVAQRESFPCKSVQPLTFKKATGLKAICLETMRDKFNWRMIDVKGILPSTLLYYFDCRFS